MTKKLNYEITEEDGLYSMSVELANGITVWLKQKVTQEELLMFGETTNDNIKKFVSENNRKLN